jgi:hypothetical protein
MPVSKQAWLTRLENRETKPKSLGKRKADFGGGAAESCVGSNSSPQHQRQAVSDLESFGKSWLSDF